MFNRLLLFAIAALSVTVLSIAQDRLPANMPTPGASSICRYGNIPMSYYSGTPNITIPLYTLNCHEVELPIYLSYDASGVQLNQLPSWTGENWSMHAGGCITRTINGYPDELIAPNAVQNPTTFHNYFSSYNMLPYYVNDRMDQLNQALQDEETDFRDLDPDVFHFNFMGHSGSFFLGNDGQWKVAGDEDFDVIFDVANYTSHLIDPFIKQFPIKELGGNYGTQPKVIEGFRLRDKNGIVYEFGIDTSAIEYTTSLVQTAYEKVQSWYAVSWFLTKVTDRLGNVLYTFTYQRGKFLARLTRAYYSDNVENSSSFSDLFHTMTYTDCYENCGNAAFPYSGELESPVYLTSINALDGTYASFSSDYDGPSSADFYPSMHNPRSYAGWRDMSGVNYSGTGDNKCLYYLQTAFGDAPQYQYEPNNHTLNYSDSILCRTRMKVLRSIVITGGSLGIGYDLIFNDDNSRMHLVGLRGFSRTISGGKEYDQKFEFSYEHYEKLPRNYVTSKVDHWGYCRAIADGQDGMTNAEQMPMTTSGKATYWQYKNPNQTNVKYGTLTKIIYPTGGACAIEYEPNVFQKYLHPSRSSMVDSVGSGGGVRVKSIAEYNDSACTQLLAKRTFSYSGGELFCKPIYYWPNWTSQSIVNGNISISSFRSCSIVPLSNSFGPSVGYSTVTETRLDGARVVRHYRNLSNSTFDELDGAFNNNKPSPFDRFSEHGYMRGRLIDEEFYDASGNKVRGIGYTYGGNEGNGTYHVLASNVRILWGSVNAGYKGRLYKFYYPRYDVTQTKDTLYCSGGTNGVTSTSYSRSYHNVSLSSPYSHTQRVNRLDYVYSARGGTTSKISYAYLADTCSLTQQFCFSPIANRRLRNGHIVDGDSLAYKSFTVNDSLRLLPHKLYTIHPDSTKEVIVIYPSYTSKGRPTRVNVMGQDDDRLYWADNDNRLLAKLHGYHADPDSIANSAAHNLSEARSFVYGYFPASGSLLWSCLGECTFYIYDTAGNVTAILNADGTVTRFIRDRAWRVTDILDTNDRTMQHFEYNYQYK